ncbi:sugar phosphate isomerase/epimerase family protein [Streptomyces sp. NPDC002276]
MIRSISVSPWWAEGKMLRGELTFEEIVDRTADMGVDGIDMQEIYLGLSPHPDPARLRHLRSYSESRGLRVLSSWFYADTLGLAGLYSPEAAVAHIGRYLAIGASLGSRYIVLQNGEPAPGTDPSTARDTLLRVYEGIAPLAERAGVVIGFEAARSFSTFNSPQGALALVKDFGSPWITVTPDFEAWRRPTDGMPIVYVENPGATQQEPLPIEVFRDCLPYAPFVHGKFLEFDENGTDPNYPVDELMAAVREVGLEHDFLVEYEGWLPEVHPERDGETEVRKGVALLRSHLGTSSAVLAGEGAK